MEALCADVDSCHAMCLVCVAQPPSVGCACFCVGVEVGERSKKQSTTATPSRQFVGYARPKPIRLVGYVFADILFDEIEAASCVLPGSKLDKSGTGVAVQLIVIVAVEQISEVEILLA